MTETNELVLKAARTHLRARRWREAEVLAERWLAKQPHSGEALAIRGLVGLANGRQEAAKDWIGTAVSLEPHSAFAYWALAQVYFASNQPDQTESCLRRTLSLAPAETEASCLLAAIYLSKADFSGAEKLLRSARALTPDSALVHLTLGELLLRLGRLAEAAPLIAVGLALDKTSVPSWILQIQVLAAQCKWSEARECGENGLLIEPENPLILIELARALVLEGSQRSARAEALREAEDLARQALTLAPKAGMAHLILGTALRAQGRADEALKLQSEMARMAPEDPVPAMEIALTFRDAGNLGAALLAARRAVDLAPDLPQAQLICSDILLLMGEFAAAFVALDQLDTLLRPGQPRLGSPLTSEDVTDRDVVLIAVTIQQALLYARYVPLLAEMGAQISIAVHQSAHGLLASLPGVKALLPLEADMSGAIIEPIARLPALLGAATQSAPMPWIEAHYATDAGKVAQLRALFLKRPGRRIGLDLGPAPEPGLAIALGGLFRELGCIVVELSPLDAVAHAFEDILVETSFSVELEQRAMMVQALDCIVAVESLTAHVAGAVGAPCHMLLPLEHDALWGATALQTPWYPRMRLYREHRQEGWLPAVRALAAALCADSTLAVQ